MPLPQQLRNYDEDSHSKWWSRLPEEDRRRFNALIYALQHDKFCPDSYVGAAKRMNQTFKLGAAMPITDEQIYALDRHLARTYYDANIMSQVMASVPGVTVAQQAPRWQGKHYTIVGDKWPHFSKGPDHAFRDLSSIRPGVDATTTEGVGWAIKWDLPFTIIDTAAGGIYSPETIHADRAAIVMGKTTTERLVLGTAGEHNPGDDLGVKGVFNYTGISEVANIDGADNDLTTAATDVEDMFLTLLGDVADQYDPGYSVLLTTGGIATEALVRESATTDRTMYERIKHKYFDSGLVNGWYVVNELDATAGYPGDAEQQAILLRLGPAVIKREVIYPLQRRPLVGDREFEDDVAYALLTADLLKIYNVNAIVRNGSDVTTTSQGIIRNGLFMQGGQATPHQFPLNPSPLGFGI